jgi:hypothetical protein
MAELAPQLNRSRPRRPRYIVGIELPRDLDGRSSAARRFKRLCRSFTEELGSGDLPEIDRQLIAQAAGMLIRAEQIRAGILVGHAVDGDEAVRLGSECRRILNSLRAKATKNKPAPPSILDIAAELAAETDGVEA